MGAKSGHMLSHYRLIGKIGEGGMGVVWKAEDTVLNRTVAIKVLPADLVIDEERRRMFLDEARLAASVSHGNIIQVHELGREGDLDFIVMEHVDGKALDEILNCGPLPPDKVADWGLQMALGLARAHNRGLIHRDLKPSNILVTVDGEVKIVDFGLAKLLKEVGSTTRSLAPVVAVDTITIEAQSIAGTLPYMSPEQLHGERLDPRSDIFSLGSVLYEMATGRRPFCSTDPEMLVQQILKGHYVPVRELVSEIPVDLDRIIEKALARRPEERYQHTDDVAVDLKRLSKQLDSGSSLSYRSLAAVRRRRFGLATVLSTALLATILLLAWMRKNDVQPVTDLTTFRQITYSGRVKTCALSPDGKFAAYIEGMNSENTLRLVQVETGNDIQLVGPTQETMVYLAFSPDGNWVLYTTSEPGEGLHTLWRISVLGGLPRKILEDIDSPPSFAPDGNHFIFTRAWVSEHGTLDMGFYVAQLDGAPELKEFLRRPEGATEIWWPQWSPDGKGIAYVQTARDQKGKKRIWISPSHGGVPHPIGESEWEGAWGGMVWAAGASGFLLCASRSRQESAQIWFVDAAKGSHHQLTMGPQTYSSIAVDESGGRVAALRRTSKSNIWVIPVLETPEESAFASHQITSGTARTMAPSLSPDGTQIVYVSDAGGQSDIWRMNADGSKARQLTFDARVDASPQWSPDGRYISYQSQIGGVSHLFLIDALDDGVRQLTYGEQQIAHAWSPDSRWICYISINDAGIQSVYRIPVEDGEPTKLSDAPVFQFLSWSPDGNWILTWGWQTIDFDGPGELLLLPTTVSGDAVKPELGVSSIWGGGIVLEGTHWSPDGRSVTILRNDSGVWVIENYPIAGGEVVRLAAFKTTDRFFDCSWAPDSKSLVCTRGDVSSDLVLLENLR